jgi:hypothetical protein
MWAKYPLPAGMILLRCFVRGKNKENTHSVHFNLIVTFLFQSPNEKDKVLSAE